jgi:hypothetical protein
MAAANPRGVGARKMQVAHLGASHQDFNASPLQPGCIPSHIISVEPWRSSRWALQNFSVLAGAQLHAGFAHLNVKPKGALGTELFDFLRRWILPLVSRRRPLARLRRRPPDQYPSPSRWRR